MKNTPLKPFGLNQTAKSDDGFQKNKKQENPHDDENTDGQISHLLRRLIPSWIANGMRA